MFGIKDIFTTINLLGGAVAICLCVEGLPWEAGIAVMAGYFFGDAIDGWVARKLGTSNQFGAEYDTIADHMSHCIAPAAIVYTVYADASLLSSAIGNKLLAGALASSIIVAASIRHARNIVRPIVFKGIWAGLPRSILGFIAIAYVNAALAPHLLGGLWLGVVLIPSLGIITLTHLPFASHHLVRTHFWYVRVLIAAFFISSLIAVVAAPEFVFDIFFFWTFGYALTGWMSLTIDERKAFRRTVRSALGKPAV